MKRDISLRYLGLAIALELMSLSLGNVLAAEATNPKAKKKQKESMAASISGVGVVAEVKSVSADILETLELALKAQYDTGAIRPAVKTMKVAGDLANVVSIAGKAKDAANREGMAGALQVLAEAGIEELAQKGFGTLSGAAGAAVAGPAGRQVGELVGTNSVKVGLLIRDKTTLGHAVQEAEYKLAKQLYPELDCKLLGACSSASFKTPTSQKVMPAQIEGQSHLLKDLEKMGLTVDQNAAQRSGVGQPAAPHNRYPRLNISASAVSRLEIDLAAHEKQVEERERVGLIAREQAAKQERLVLAQAADEKAAERHRPDEEQQQREVARQRRDDERFASEVAREKRANAFSAAVYGVYPSVSFNHAPYQNNFRRSPSPFEGSSPAGTYAGASSRPNFVPSTILSGSNTTSQTRSKPSSTFDTACERSTLGSALTGPCNKDLVRSLESNPWRPTEAFFFNSGHPSSSTGGGRSGGSIK